MTFAHKAVGNLVVLAHARGQREAAYRPPARWEADRDARIAATARYAARHVPYYRRLFPELGIDPRRIRSPRDLETLPLLDKETVRRDPEEFRARSWRGRSSIPFVTSGSTGAPLRVFHDLGSLLANIAYGERARKSRDTGRAGPPRILSFTRDASTGAKVREIYRRWTYIPHRPERLNLGVDRPFAEALAEIERYRPDVIVGYGSYLEALFRYIDTEGIEIRRPARVGYFSDGMTVPGRRLIEERFGIPVVASYSAMESFKIGFTCEEGSGYHIHADLCHVRVVDDEGADSPPGERGEIVISNLINRGSVLLNYRLGDIGMLSPEPCPCGRTFPLLSELEGRREDLLHLEQGRVVHPRAVWDVFARLTDIVQYQLTQLDPRRFELQIVVRERGDRQATLAAAADRLRVLLGDVEIRVKASAGPLTGPGGKARPVVSLYTPPELPAAR